jgi:TetR/AcrR family transcriptional regulator, cholesterol catabolism regulator
LYASTGWAPAYTRGPLARRPDQKTRIRRKAAKLFAAQGYDATGIQELSDVVGLGRGALYHHIGSKEQLLFDIITLSVIDVVVEAEGLVGQDLSAEEKVRRLSRMMTATVADNLAEWKVFFRELEALSGPLRSEALAWRQRFEDVWAAVIGQGVKRGEFRAFDPIVVKGILGMHNYAHVWIFPRGRLNPDEISEVFCDLLLTGLRAR